MKPDPSQPVVSRYQTYEDFHFEVSRSWRLYGLNMIVLFLGFCLFGLLVSNGVSTLISVGAALLLIAAINIAYIHFFRNHVETITVQNGVLEINLTLFHRTYPLNEIEKIWDTSNLDDSVVLDTAQIALKNGAIVNIPGRFELCEILRDICVSHDIPFLEKVPKKGSWFSL